VFNEKLTTGGASASQQIPRLLWNSKAHRRVHNKLPLLSVFSHINPVNALPSYLFSIQLNTNLPPTPASFKKSHWFRPPH
jgi:hypothetical protein